MKNLLLLTLFCVACSPSPEITKQNIPGRVECEHFDIGGEGIAYHDTDSVNNGSVRLNTADGSFFNEFRMEEGVDISYTKTSDIDNNAFNKVEPDSNQLYVDWTAPGEWINYTVEVNETAVYRIGLMYTANGGGSISLGLDAKPVTGRLLISSTHDSNDSVAWRQWHHWNKIDSLSSIRLEKGTHKLTLHVVDHGNMNFDYLEFTRGRE